MKKLVVKGNISNIPHCTINNFEEEYSNYLPKAKKNWKNKEGFSLEFNSTLEDLLQSHFVYVDGKDLELLIKKRFNVIEEIEL